MTDTRSQILELQRDWAIRRKIDVDGSGYTKTLNANLFQPPHRETLEDFRGGDGGELDRKMRALHSSSALVVNTFDYWRGRSLAWIAGMLSLGSEPASVRFEAQFRTGLRGNPPNLDIVFVLADGRTVAVESKFTETYSHVDHAQPFKDKYFPSGDGLWHGRGLPRCQKLASQMRWGEAKFRYLNAAQLLKHGLGLARSVAGRFSLFYFWYDVPSDEATQHAKEVNEFSHAIAPELDFHALTYQKLFSSALRDIRAEHAAYKNYLCERYFPLISARCE